MLDRTNTNNNSNSNSKNAFTTSNYEARMRMIQGKKMPTAESDYHLEGNRRVYHSKESERLAQIRVATARPLSNNDVDYSKRNINRFFDSNPEEQEEHEKIMQ